MIQEDSHVVEHKELASRYFMLTLHSKYISTQAVPGQFVELKVSDDTDPLLRRPFSIHRIDPAKQTFEILYEVLGKGTGILSQKKVGEIINVLGPLGNGFSIDKEKKIALLVGGGMGIAPLLSLANALRITHPALLVYVFIGAKTANAILCEQDFRDVGAQVVTSTDDGTHGKKGFVSDVLLDFLNSQLSTVNFQLSTIYSCGPTPMLKAVSEIAQQKQINCQLSMEAFMACGIGACKGCAIETKNGYKMACKDGPVFPAEVLLW